MPKLPEFVARRMVSGNKIAASPKQSQQSSADQLRTIQRVAPGFKVENVGERGVVHHQAFRNRTAVQTHPLNRHVPCTIYRELEVSQGTRLRMKVSHHPHGDWQLRVLVNNQVVTDRIVNPKSLTKEWLEVSVDLSNYAGQKVSLAIENRANDWHNEWAYWHEIKVID